MTKYSQANSTKTTSSALRPKIITKQKQLAKSTNATATIDKQKKPTNKAASAIRKTMKERVA